MVVGGGALRVLGTRPGADRRPAAPGRAVQRGDQRGAGLAGAARLRGDRARPGGQPGQGGPAHRGAASGPRRTTTALVGAVEQRWRDRFGADHISELADRSAGCSPRPGGQQRIAAGLVPYPGGWRAHPPYLSQTEAMLADPAGALPYYPMVSHRGGFPDGS